MGIKVKTRKTIEGAFPNGNVRVLEEVDGTYTVTFNEDEMNELYFANKKEFVETLGAINNEL